MPIGGSVGEEVKAKDEFDNNRSPEDSSTGTPVTAATSNTGLVSPPTEMNDPISGQSAATHPWTEMKDPTSGQTYYHNSATNETSWTRPPAKEEEAKLTPSEIRGWERNSKEQQAEAGETSAAAATNPWTEMKDPASGHTYYFNSKTGQSTWVRPVE